VIKIFKILIFHWKIKIHIIFYKIDMQIEESKHTMSLFLFVEMLYALHYPYKLPNIFEFKPWKIQYNYHIAFDYISSLVETMVLITILSNAPCFHPLGPLVGEPRCLQLTLSEWRWRKS
jgi:hypothetical protein